MCVFHARKPALYIHTLGITHTCTIVCLALMLFSRLGVTPADPPPRLLSPSTLLSVPPHCSSSLPPLQTNTNTHLHTRTQINTIRLPPHLLSFPLPSKKQTTPTPGPKDNANHVILGTQTSKPKDLAGQMSLSPDHCWGIVRALVDMLMKQPEGERVWGVCWGLVWLAESRCLKEGKDEEHQAMS